MPFDEILAHAPIIGHTGYANHAREFFTELTKQIPTRVRNFTHVPNIDYLTQQQKDMIVHQTWAEPPWSVGTPYIPRKKVLNIVLMETNHFYFYDSYTGPKIAFNVWESTRFPDQFFSRLKTFDYLWVPSAWQRDCAIEQGMSPDKVFVVPEGVDLNRFKPLDTPTPYSDGRFKFIIFGRWDYRKYTTEMVRAFIETFKPDEPVDLIISVDNPFPVDGCHSTEERLKFYNLEDPRIKILHFPSDEEYVSYLQKGNCLISSSRSEGWNLPASEALACGTPTIITDWGAPLEFGKAAYKVRVKEFKKPENVFMQGSNVPGVWAEPDYDHLKETLRYVYENYDECKKQTMENIDFIRQFTWKNAADIAMNIINNIDDTKYYPVKLNVGSGIDPKEGYINIDKYDPSADIQADALSLPYENNSINEIYSSHTLEHFNKYNVPKVLNEWYRVLNYDGKLAMDLPNFEACVKNWLASDDKMGFPLDTLFGLQTREGEEHKIGFTRETLYKLLLDSGFTDITIKDINSHAQECFDVSAYKRELKYDDDIFIIDCYPNTDEKMDILRESISRTKKTGKPIAIVTHYILPNDVIESVDYVIYDKNNPLSENYGLTYWAVEPKVIKIVTSLDSAYHGLACLTSIKNGATFLRHKYKFAHFIEYDVIADLDKYLKKVNYYRQREKKFIGYDYHNTEPREDGFTTNFFSFDLSWFDDKMVTLSKWNEYQNEAYAISSRINKMADMIFEHWLYHYFEDREMLNDCYIMTLDEKKSIIIKGNVKDQTEEEPKVNIRISETIDRDILVLINSNNTTDESYKIEHNDIIVEGVIKPGKTVWKKTRKIGVIKVTTDTMSKEFIIDPNEQYTSTIFKFYDNDIKCLVWADEYDKGFIDNSTNDMFLYTFKDGAKTEILGPSDVEYEVSFTNDDTKLTVYTSKIKPNHWSSPSPKYLVNWDIVVKNKDEIVSSHKFDVTGKNVLIQTDSKAIGDTLAWLPYLDEFRKEKNCIVYGRTWHNKLFSNEYPEIIWIEPGQEPRCDIYASYFVGCGDNDYNRNKQNWRSIPLQKVATDYLGLDYKEIRPKVTKMTSSKPIKDKYVAISEHSTFQCKYWLYPKGWQIIIDYLKTIGYKTMVISKEETKLKNIVNRTNRSMEESINNIQHASLFMGVSSGPTWLAWALDVPTVLISGYSAKWGEYNDNCARIVQPEGKCGGCFNDRDAVIDRGNWNWCPRSKNFECSTNITPEMVIQGINKFLK